MQRRVLNFQTHVAERRFDSVAYDAGYKAFGHGEPMQSPLRDDVFRKQWYEGYLDAKYPDDKYALEGRDAKQKITDRR